ncbi:succinate-semialdehyde dehydrogenase, mitochondrial-like [Mya arenaria]|uniref:succinate-semialdehyde dehydrogenase, mitochondrial-like n=1 Tax=Mya arenaria TaxID=6604 RepID=UPI0022E2D56A|nr:succinate-semialdehyde dehydrogenase, mitochondrial-like [Mya arenaria]
MCQVRRMQASNPVPRLPAACLQPVPRLPTADLQSCVKVTGCRPAILCQGYRLHTCNPVSRLPTADLKSCAKATGCRPAILCQVFNPSTEEVVGSVANMGCREAEDAVSKAYSAFQTWKATTAKGRSDLLKKAYQLVMKNKEKLARIITLENGKPYRESLGEVAFGSSYIEWYAEECRRVQGTVISSPSQSKRMMTIKQPIGVCALITPWNFPLTMVTRKACAALSVGCTVVLKPSEETPLTALTLAELFREAGLPEGVFNVVTCDRDGAADIGGTLCESPLVSLLSFTGSSAVGKILLNQASGTVKRCHMELGGNAPFIVMSSADLDDAVKGALDAKFRNTGQTCICPNRFLVQEDVHDEFVKRLNIAMEKQLVTGDGFAVGTTQGPLINAKAVDKVDDYVKDAVSKGAKLVRGGTRSSSGTKFYPSTVLTGVTLDMRCMHEEIFGPIIAIYRFKTEEEAIRIANATSYGLAGYAYTTDSKQQWRMAEALDFGIVGLNEGLVSTAESPHGGFKESGIGREGGIGIGLDDFLEVKYVCIGGL